MAILVAAAAMQSSTSLVALLSHSTSDLIVWEVGAQDWPPTLHTCKPAHPANGEPCEQSNGTVMA